MEKAAKILQQYHIFPQSVMQVTNRVQKIKANGNQYALKKSKLKKDQIEHWVRMYHMANEQQLLHVLPIYLTKNQQLYVQENETYYYLSPWIDHEIKDLTTRELRLFFKQIGKVHLETKKPHALKSEKLVETFRVYKKTCQTAEKSILKTVDDCERSHYPSPLQLQILTHFKDVSLALRLSEQLTDRFLSLIEADVLWGTSLTHGDLKKSHIFENYLINWEQSRFQHASMDLIRFFNHESREYGTASALLENFPAYLEENPLENHELTYIALYLLNVHDYLHHVDRMQSPDRKSQSIAAQTVILERAYRRIIFGLQFHERLVSFEKPVQESMDSN